MGAALTARNWEYFRQVAENVNGVIGVAEDVGNAECVRPRPHGRGRARDPRRARGPRLTHHPHIDPLPRHHTHTLHRSPYYTWGALFGFVSFLEAGVY